MKYQRNITGVDEFIKDYENVVLPNYGVPQDDLIEQVGEMAVENRGSSFSTDFICGRTNRKFR